MTTMTQHDERMATMTFASVYPHYVKKVERKNRTISELNQVIEWLTGFDQQTIIKMIDSKVTFKEFFECAELNPKVHLITGMICGYRIEKIENPLTQKVRYLDKLVDELAKGKTMDKIFRGTLNT